MVPLSINNLINAIVSHNVDNYLNQIENSDIYARSFRVVSQINYEMLRQIILHTQNSNSNQNPEPNQNSNESNISSINYRYELNSQTKIYSIYEINSGELKTTLTEQDVNIVIREANCSLNQAIKALIEQDCDIVNAIMALTM